MKRLFSLLTVFVMVFALSVPALAVDIPKELPFGDGAIVLPDTVASQFAYGEVRHFFEVDNYYVYLSDKPITANVLYPPCTVYMSFDGVTWFGDGVISNEEIEIATSDNYDVLWTNVSSAECDGSACPATDKNADGVCDDCGRTLSLRLVGYPSLPSVNGSNLEGVVLQRDDGYFYMALTSDTSYSVSGTLGDNYLITVADEQEVNYTTYKCTDGQNWVQNNSGKAYSLSVGDPSATLLASTFEWYKDGDLFFPHPPTLEEVTQEALGEMMQSTGGTMSTLVLCGVGCLALLAVLKLFGKRSLLFLR